jgi:dephospho-CoA kinase
MKVIGLTGPTGSGKGVFGSYLSEKGIPVADTDAIYHGIIGKDGPCMEALRARFGDEIAKADGSLDRPRLAAIVFCGGEEQAVRCRALNEITHGYVLREVRLWLAEQREKGMPAACVDAPLLVESGFHRECDVTVSVLASKAVRLSRIMARDSISEAAAISRISSQKSDDFYRQNSDFVIENEGTEEEFRQKADEALERILFSE